MSFFKPLLNKKLVGIKFPGVVTWSFVRQLGEKTLQLSWKAHMYVAMIVTFDVHAVSRFCQLR